MRVPENGGGLWMRTGPQRSILQRHLQHLAGVFRCAGWRILDSSQPPGPEDRPLAVLEDPLSEVTPELVSQLAAATRLAPGWIVPRVLGLPGAQGWSPSLAPETWQRYRSLHRRQGRRRPRLRQLAGPEPPWLGLRFTADPDLGLSSPPTRPESEPENAARFGAPARGESGEPVWVVPEALLFRYPDPADHDRVELLELIPGPVEGTVLDIGCGAGRTTARFREAGIDAIGVEPDPTLAASARERLPEVRVATAEEVLADGEPHTLAGVVLADVLEHLIDPEAVLALIRRSLRPDGFLLVSVPNSRFEPLLHDLEKGFWDVTLAGVQARDHLRPYTASSLRQLLAEAGLGVRQEHFFPVELRPADRRRARWRAWRSRRPLAESVSPQVAVLAVPAR